MALADPQSPIIQEIAQPVDFLALHRSSPQRYPFLLESRARNETARYDILFAFPQQRLTLTADQVTRGPHADEDGFLSALDRWFESERITKPVIASAAWQSPTDAGDLGDCHVANVPRNDEVDLPFTGGWFLYLGYELAQEIEPVLNLPMPAEHERIAEAVRIPAAFIHDYVAEQTWLVVEPDYAHLITDIEQDIATVAASVDSEFVCEALTEEDPELYLQRVRRTLQYIYDGDVFQANLSRPWQIHLKNDTEAGAIYARLRETNPGPYNGLAVWDDQAVISSSPELLLNVRNRRINTRPIAGTRPRGQDQQQDSALSSELLGHHKERAEHVMLIDLERNDLGRVCRPGTVEVNELMVLESYAHVHHIVSNVRGELRDDVMPGEVIRALFPGGTITGCPKVRCMEIIAELEQQPRGAYTGSMGYLNRTGDMDLNILIRTLEMHGQALSCRAGAGIVIDSDPEHELEETRAKARGMLLAITDELT